MRANAYGKGFQKVQFEEKINCCVACYSSDISYWMSKFKDGFEYRIFKCKKCSCGFMNPRPSDRDLDLIYEKSGHGLEHPIQYSEIKSQEEEFPNSTVDAERLVSFAYQYLSINSNSSKIKKALDIGSGYGFFSLCAKKYGFDVFSINPGKYENDVCRQMFSMNGYFPKIKVGLFQDFKFEEEEFDFVILSQVLEHVKYPHDMMKEISRILKWGGMLALAVPNFESLFVKLRGTKDNSCLWVPEHLNYFTEKSLKYIISDMNLNLEKVYQISKIPYYTLSNKLRLKHGTLLRYFMNNVFSLFQYIPCRILELLKAGNYINAFFIKRKYMP